MDSMLPLPNVARSAPFIVEDDPGTSANHEPDRSDDGRLMYYEHQVQRRDAYRGFWSDKPVEEVRAELREAWHYTDALNPDEFPLPPAGLPGRCHKVPDREGEVAEVVALGLEYASAVIFNERRTMHNVWDRAERLLRDVRKEAEEAIYARITAANQQRQAEAEAAVAKQVVYFIGAASGPIKIGIAANPMSRLSALQTSHHERLNLLATCPGGAAQERAYHKQFAEFRLAGEWFQRVEPILSEIDRIAPPETSHAQ